MELKSRIKKQQNINLVLTNAFFFSKDFFSAVIAH